MKAGLTSSVVLHSALLVFGLVSLGAPKPHEVTDVEALPVDVGRIAAENRIVLTDLRPVQGGLEDLFLELTSDSQRDDLAHAPQTSGANA